MGTLRLMLTAAALFFCLVTTGSELQAQVRERIIYFATSTPTGKATARPNPNCKLVEIGGRTLWACPTRAPRKDTFAGSDNRNGGFGGHGSGGSGGMGSDGGRGMGGADSGGGMN
ncbi:MULTISPECIES: hypothetical protein [unclassified Sinorhizobium]|uniref:hypothetical protein n=1 Tax=unclassified Sinorhizobium TaxID=2613772 RepID=UPI0035243D50